ncbi:MAG: hypothetical protein SNH57_05925, partial [Rikenellaceae bacterium]
MSTAKRVVKNTGYLYAKMGVTVFISLYTTRLILNSLGASDFGIFNIVGGAIAMLGFLNAAMASATQRFMSYSEGEGYKEKQKTIFNISFVLHIGIALLVGLVLFGAGFVFFNGVLNIPEDRFFAAQVVYGSLIVSTMFTVATVPYDAVMNAHENMKYYAVVGILESALKLSVALVVARVVGDKLIVYGVLMACIPLIILTIMRVYCHKNYEECVIAPRRYWDRSLAKEMGSFAGFNLMRSSSSMISQYGLNIVLNNFFGVILNAAQGIANQVSGQLMTFSNVMLKALSPVITKSEGNGDRELMIRATMMGCKFSYMLLSFFAIPFILEAPYILKLWLKDVPDWAVLLCQLQLLKTLVVQLTISVGSAIDALGDIKLYSIVTCVIEFMPIICSFILFKFNFPPYWMYIVWILFGGIIGGILRLYVFHQNSGINIRVYCRNVIFACLAPTIISILFAYILKVSIYDDFVRLMFTCIIVTITILVSSWFIA